MDACARVHLCCTEGIMLYFDFHSPLPFRRHNRVDSDDINRLYEPWTCQASLGAHFLLHIFTFYFYGCCCFFPTVFFAVLFSHSACERWTIPLLMCLKGENATKQWAIYFEAFSFIYLFHVIFFSVVGWCLFNVCSFPCRFFSVDFCAASASACERAECVRCCSFFIMKIHSFSFETAI